MDALTRAAVRHTLHCLFGCSIGEILGMSVTTLLGWSILMKVAFSVPLAFFFGYLLTSWSMVRKGASWRTAVAAAFGTDSASILSMEVVDSAFLLLIPGAMSAHLSDAIYWYKVLASLLVAFVITVPVNRYLIARSGSHHHH